MIFGWVKKQIKTEYFCMKRETNKKKKKIATRYGQSVYEHCLSTTRYE